jgi:membrane-associated phospholipid phosphatase
MIMMPTGVARRAVGIAAACVVLMVAIYLLAVWTKAGQQVEDAVLQAADGTPRDAPVGALDLLSPWTAAAAFAVVVLAGWRRGGPVLAFAGGGVVVGPVLTAQVLRRWVLPRPALFAPGPRQSWMLDAVDHQRNQSYPSGHTAMALAVMCALVMVTPHRFRTLVTVVTSSAIGVGALTVTAGMHRPSDTLGSCCLVLVWVCAALVLLQRRNLVRTVESGHGRTLGGVFFGVAAVACLLWGAVAGRLVPGEVAAAPDPQLLVLRDALTAGRAISLAGGLLVASCLLVLVHRVDFQRPSVGAGAAPDGGDGLPEDLQVQHE